jgi:DNA repair protein RadC
MSEKDYYKANNKGYLTIRDWREDERPRERLVNHGPAALSDSELLAILISSGTKGFSALDAARELLKRHDSLGKLSTCDLSEFRQVHGLGNARAIGLAAAFEIGKRIAAEPHRERRAIRSPEDIAGMYIPRLRGLRNEVFYVLLLNASNQIFREVQVSEGSLNSSIVHPREVFRLAITESAASVILMHNHPSGNPRPSQEDINVTRQVIEAGKVIDIKVFDHIIIAGTEYTSLARLGLI